MDDKAAKAYVGMIELQKEMRQFESDLKGTLSNMNRVLGPTRRRSRPKRRRRAGSGPRLCPKCRAPATGFVEYWTDHSIAFGACNGLPDGEDGELQAGCAYKVEAQCGDCGHEWRLRGVKQISDLEG